jgi:hypothetical protein
VSESLKAQRERVARELCTSAFHLTLGTPRRGGCSECRRNRYALREQQQAAMLKARLNPECGIEDLLNEEPQS